MEHVTTGVTPHLEAREVNVASQDPRLHTKNEMLTLTEDLKDIQIGPLDHQVTKLGTSLFGSRERYVISLLKRNINLFAQGPSDMPEIDTRVLCQNLAIDSIVNSVSQRKCKVGEEKRATIDEDVLKLRSISFITEFKYPCWLANIVFVRKSLNK